MESLKNSRKQQEWHEQVVHDLGSTLKKRPESDEWLQNELDQYDERISVHEEHKRKLGKVYEELQSRLKTATATLRAKDSERGKYEAEIANHGKQIEGQKSLIQATAQAHGIRGFDDDLDDAKIQDFMLRITKIRKDQSAALAKARRETESELQSVRDALSTLREQQTVLGRDKNAAKDQLLANDRKIASCQSQVDNISVDEGSKALLESSVQDLNEKLKRARDDWSKGSWDTKLQKANAQISAIDEETEQLDREMAEANKKAGELARLDFLKKETDDRQKRLDTMSRAYGSRLGDIVGQDWSPTSLERDYQAIVQDRTTKVREAEVQQKNVGTKLQQVDIRLSSVRSELKKGEKEMESCAVRVRNSFAMDDVSIDPDNYRESLEKLQEERDLVKSDLDSFAFENDYFSKCLKALNNKHICKTCERPIQKPEEKARLAKKLNDALNRDKKEVEDDFERLENELKRAKDAAPSHTMWERLSQTELPRFRSQIKELEKSRGEILIEMEGCDRVIEDRQQSLKEADSVSQPVNKIVKELQDFTAFRAQAEELASKQKDAGLSRTSDEIQKELDLRRKNLKSLRADINKLTEERENARTKINALELELSRAKSSLDMTNHQLENKASIERQIDDLQQQNQELRESMKHIDEQVKSLAPRIAEEETKHDDIQQRGSDRQKELQDQVDRLSDSINKLQHSAQAIESHAAEGAPSKLKRCQREIEATQQNISQMEHEQTQTVKEINKIQLELSNQETNKRVIEDNIRYRKSQRDLDELKKEIARLSAQNAEADLAQHQKEADHWSRQYNLHATAKTEKLATMRAKDAESQRMIRDYETDYKDAGRRYKETHIKVEVESIDSPRGDKAKQE